MQHPSNFTIVTPKRCLHCGNEKLHKADHKNQIYKDFIDNEVVEIQVRRQRYRCASCGSKVWDTVIGASSYLRKSVLLIRKEKQRIKENRKGQ